MPSKKKKERRRPIKTLKLARRRKLRERARARKKPSLGQRLATRLVIRRKREPKKKKLRNLIQKSMRNCSTQKRRLARRL